MTGKTSKPHNRAYDLISLALQGGAITLAGPSSAANPTKSGENDAKYLAALLQGLTDTLAAPSDREAQ